MPLIDTVAEALAGRRAAAGGGQLRARPGRRGVGRRGDPRPVRERQDPRHVARASRLAGETVLTVRPLALDGGDDVRRGHAVRRAGPRRPARLRAPGPDDRRRGDRDLRGPRRAAARHRAGRGPDGGHERGRGQGPARRPVPAAAGLDARTRAPADAAPRGGVVLRPADRRRAGAAAHDVGVRRRLRPASICAVVEGGDEVEVLQTSTRWCASRSSSPTTRPRARATASSRRSGSSPRTGWRKRRRSRRRATGTPRTSRTRRPPAGSTGTGPGGATRSTGWRSSWATCASAFRWSAARGDVEVATDIAAHAALMGFSVQLFETLAWAEELLEAAAAADVRRLPRLYTGAGYACFAGRADAGARERAPRDRAGGRLRGYDAVRARATRSFIEALGQVYCGDLDRYVELTGEVAGATDATRGYGLASYVDGLQSAAGSRRRSRSPRSRSPPRATLGNPYWISYALWIAGMAFSQGRRAPRPRGVGRGRRLRARAPRPVLRGLPRPRRGAPAHVRRRARGRAGAVRRGHRRVPARRQRAAADHHAGQRARAVRAPRPSRRRRRRCSARCPRAVELPPRPELAELGDRVSRTLGAERAAELDVGRRGARPQRRGRLRPPADRRRPARPDAASSVRRGRVA